MKVLRRSLMLVLSTLFTAACANRNVADDEVDDSEPPYVPDPTVVGPELGYITFGSCMNQDKPHPILDSIVAERPDLFIFLGDNIYADTDDPEEMDACYRRLSIDREFRTFRAAVPIVATWDDHDYGQNDIGLEYVAKRESRQMMLDFWSVPKGTPRWTQPDGIYGAYEFGPHGRRVQVILLDLRWNRTAVNPVSLEVYRKEREPAKMGPYQPVLDAGATMLGEKQWQWLEAELQKPADLRILGSSIQLIADFTGWESWAGFPADRKRFFELLRKYEIDNLVIISGDTHWAELSRIEGETPEPLWEITSSGLTETWDDVSPNRHRVGDYYVGANYGYIRIDWQASPPRIEVGVKDVQGNIIMSRQLVLGSE